MTCIDEERSRIATRPGSLPLSPNYSLIFPLFRHFFFVVVRLAWKKVLGRKGFSSHVYPYCLAVFLRLVPVYCEAYCPFMGTHSASRGYVW